MAKKKNKYNKHRDDNFIMKTSSRKEDLKFLAPFIEKYGDTYFLWVVKTMADLRKRATVPEVIIAKYLRLNRVRYITQAPFRIFREGDGCHTFFADFYIPALDLIIEVDGNQHQEPEQLLYDIRRDEDFARIGIRTLRIKNRDVHNGRFRAMIPIQPEEHLIPIVARVIPEGVSGIKTAQRIKTIDRLMLYQSFFGDEK